MKEAAGEANMTVITIVLIGVVAAVGLTLIPKLMKKARAKSCCTDGGWIVSGKFCCEPGHLSQCDSDSYHYTLGGNAMSTATRFKECLN